MNKVIIPVIVVVLGVGSYFIFLKSSDDKTSTPTATPATSTPTPASTPSTTGATNKAIATIAYVNNSFTPSNLTVKAGDKIMVKNTASVEIGFYSNPHPVHTDNSELNVGMISPGQSKTFTVTQTGTFGYHNHLDATQGGTITIN